MATATTIRSATAPAANDVDPPVTAAARTMATTIVAYVHFFGSGSLDFTTEIYLPQARTNRIRRPRLLVLDQTVSGLKRVGPAYLT